MWEKLLVVVVVVVACRIIVLSPGPGLCYSQRFSEILWLTLTGHGLDMDLDRRLQYPEPEAGTHSIIMFCCHSWGDIGALRIASAASRLTAVRTLSSCSSPGEQGQLQLTALAAVCSLTCSMVQRHCSVCTDNCSVLASWHCRRPLRQYTDCCSNLLHAEKLQ